MKVIRSVCIAGVLMALSGPAVAELTGNVTVTNNYLWRGLTQTTNDAAVQGGIDYAHKSGLYIGTWVSNVKYDAGDVFSYEHDIYFGIAGGDNITWDAGWLYYNYDNDARFDFHELYASVGWKGLSAKGFLLTGTEADEPTPGTDYGFGAAYYVQADYTYEFSNGLGLGAHIGRHAGDFNEGFNAVPGDYTDYNINLTYNGLMLMISDTDLDDPGPEGLDNASMKYVISYTFDFGLAD